MWLELLAAAVVSADGEAVKIAPPCDGAAYRQFDFWVGEWDVAAPDGKAAGRNSIKLIEGGCALEERWRSVSGREGRSINYYNPHKDRWVQVWVGLGIICNLEGQADPNGAMRLEGTITYLADRTQRGFRGVWTLRSDGVVTQVFHERQPDGTWTLWFEGEYRRL